MYQLVFYIIFYAPKFCDSFSSYSLFSNQFFDLLQKTFLFETFPNNSDHILSYFWTFQTFSVRPIFFLSFCYRCSQRRRFCFRHFQAFQVQNCLLSIFLLQMSSAQTFSRQTFCFRPFRQLNILSSTGVSPLAQWSSLAKMTSSKESLR